MSPGGPPLGDNRFALLSASPDRKRKKHLNITKDLFPTLPVLKKENPKYLVASAVDSNKPLSKYSCFAVHKALKNVSNDILNIAELRDGNLLLLVKNSGVAQKFISTKYLYGICQVKFDLHNNLNSSKGTIYAPCLNDIQENEIIENLKVQGVTSVYKFPKYIDGKPFPSGVLLLTFDLYHLPDKIEVSWYTTKVRPYYPNPMRCKNCQLLGHTVKRCNKTPVCDNCSLPPHNPSPCTRSLCANCSGNHSASSKSCPKYIQMKQIITIKTDNKCSMREAIQIQRKQIPQKIDENSTTFSEVAKKSQSKNNQNNTSEQNTQTIKPTTNNISDKRNNVSKENADNSQNTPYSNNSHTVESVDTPTITNTLSYDFISQINCLSADLIPQLNSYLSSSAAFPLTNSDTDTSNTVAMNDNET